MLMAARCRAAALRASAAQVAQPDGLLAAARAAGEEARALLPFAVTAHVVANDRPAADDVAGTDGQGRRVTWSPHNALSSGVSGDISRTRFAAISLNGIQLGNDVKWMSHSGPMNPPRFAAMLSCPLPGVRR